MDNKRKLHPKPSQKKSSLGGQYGTSITVQAPPGQQFLTSLYREIFKLTETLKLSQKQTTIVRLYCEFRTQDEASASNIDAIDAIRKRAKKDEKLCTALKHADQLIEDTISAFHTYQSNASQNYDLAALREEYAELWKRNDLSANDDERLRLIVQLATTNNEIAKIVDDVDRAFLETHCHKQSQEVEQIYEHPQLKQHYKNCMAKVSERLGSQGSIQMTEPASDTGSSLAPDFVGREPELTEIFELMKRGGKILLIRGQGGVGKTSLCHRFLERHFDEYLRFPTASEITDLTAIEELVEKQLSILGELPGQNFQSSLMKMKNLLRSQRIGVLIDNLETVIDHNGNFVNSHHGYIKLLQFLSSPETKAVTLITSRKRLKTTNFRFSEFRLTGLTAEDWQLFFERAGIVMPIDDLRWLHEFHAGNAKAMDILRGKLSSETGFNIINYCLKLKSSPVTHNCKHDIDQGITSLQSAKNLGKLIVSEFDALEQLESRAAYKLLLRLGCFRQQETVVFLDREALSYLLWDIPDNQKDEAIQILRERALLDSTNQQHYQLHPIVRKESLRRLLRTNEWSLANVMAANYWTHKVITVDSATAVLQALEAYRHYMMIEDFRAAAAVLTYKRKNAFGTHESLVRSLYKFGFPVHVEEAIKELKGKDISDDQRIKLRHTRGAIAWLKGDIDKAIKHCHKVHQHAKERTEQGTLSTTIRVVDLNAYLTTGLCYLGRWQLEDALRAFERVNELAQGLGAEKFSPCALFYSAYIHSLNEPISNDAIARRTANKLFEKWNINQMPSWLTEYRLYYLGLTFTHIGEFDKALKIHTSVLDDKFYSRYTQAKTKHFNGLACCHRQMGNHESALDYHGQAIASFKSIGARIDLAEAFFQQAITFFQCGKFRLALASFGNADSIFEEMNAPLQQKRLDKWKQENKLLQFALS